MLILPSPRLAPEPYHPRQIACIDIWTGADHVMKIYGIHSDPDAGEPPVSRDVIAAVHAAMHGTLSEHACDARSHGLGFCIVHIGQEAVWLLVDWWISGGILNQKMLSAPLSRPKCFAPVTSPALACVWELVVTGHERDAWVRHMLNARPDKQAYLADTLAPGRY